MRNLLQKIAIIALGLASLISPFQNIFADLSGNDTEFIVTAYYSPLPGQSRYTTGSYAGDIRLNGGGKTTASGMDVFTGLLAAPSGYDYGTKIHFKGFGVGQVEDRGGAIVRSGVRGYEHDRIDIWMGYGDEGLNRALRWGKRTIEGKVVDDDTEVSLKLGKTFLGKYGGVTVGPDSPELSILKLQELFIDVNLYSGEIDGKYESIKDSIIDFQIGAGIIDSRNHGEAGYFGNKSRAALREQFSFTPLVEENINLYSGAVAPAPLTQGQKILIRYDGLEVSPESGSDNIKKLQMLFSELGLYKGNIDGVYESIEGALLNFQIGAEVVNNKDGWGAGYYGELTRKALFEYFENEVQQVEVIEKVEEIKEVVITLSSSEKRELDKLVKILEQELEKISERTDKSYNSLVRTISKRIDTLSAKAKTEKLKLKLEYIKENI